MSTLSIPESTSAKAFDQYVRGRLVAASNGWKNLLVRVYSEPRVEERVIYPAVAEPRIVRILSAAAVVEEREPGGPWVKTRVQAGDFFLTASQSPYEVRWRAIEPHKTMHVYLGLLFFNRAWKRHSKKIREQFTFGMYLASKTIFYRSYWRSSIKSYHRATKVAISPVDTAVLTVGRNRSRRLRNGSIGAKSL
jgi:hypothetical protein